MRPRSIRLFLPCLLLVMAACARSGCTDAAPTGTVAAAADPSATTAPALPPDLQAVYDRSCKSCHSIPATGAPQSGDTTAWAPRAAQGVDVLLDHTINGYKAMPPLGACMDCDEAQFRALIAHMATLEPTP